MFRLFSHHCKCCLGGGERTESRQWLTVSLEDPLGPDLCYPPWSSSPSCRFTLSPCPECDFQPQTSVRLDCWSCVYSLVGFLFMNVGWGKYSDSRLQRGGAWSLIGANRLCGWGRGIFLQIGFAYSPRLVILKSLWIAFKLSEGCLFFSPQLQNDRFLLGLIFLPGFIWTFSYQSMLTTEAVCWKDCMCVLCVCVCLCVRVYVREREWECV